jgi:hypothetical protein
MKNENPVVVREFLPFTVKLAKDAASLQAALQVRQSAYARHLPEVAKTMVEAEAWDFSEGNVVLIAQSKLDGTPLGTMRIHSNEFAQLPLEQSYSLPQRFAGLRLLEVTRFGVAEGRVGQTVKTALLKACGLYSMAVNADCLVIVARAPLDRMYQRILFKDVDESKAFIPMAHVGGLPHRVLYEVVEERQTAWQAAQHPLYRFMYETDHPDIMIPAALQAKLPADLLTAFMP